MGGRGGAGVGPAGWAGAEDGVVGSCGLDSAVNIASTQGISREAARGSAATEMRAWDLCR